MADSAALSLDYQSAFYFQNNEYFGPFTEGFTGIGSIQQLKAVYDFDRRHSVEVGVHARTNFGDVRVLNWLPIFSYKVKLNHGFKLIFGTLEGGLRHNWFEPLYRFDGFYQNPVEYGIQMLKTQGMLRYDLWLDWQTFIERGDGFQEKFVLGMTGKWNPFSSGNAKIAFPFQAKVEHIGGQIDTSPNELRSLLNAALGLEVEWKSSPKSAVKTWRIVGMIFQGLDTPDEITDPNFIPVDNGWALYPSFAMRKKGWIGTLGLWISDSFYAPEGEYLFSSWSENDRDFTDATRRVVVMKLAKELKKNRYSNISVNAGVYYDLERSRLDWNVGIYAMIGKRFLLFR